MTQAQHETFREELAIKYPTFGYALWEPDPMGQDGAVEVGDVGFIRTGHFFRLFNVLCSASGDDFPENHNQLTIGRDLILTGIERYKEFLSKNVTVESRGRQPNAQV
jgi:hypothetical protein